MNIDENAIDEIDDFFTDLDPFSTMKSQSRTLSSHERTIKKMKKIIGILNKKIETQDNIIADIQAKFELMNHYCERYFDKK